MNSRREQVWVGLFVLAAAALLIGSVLSVAGTFSRGNIPHRAYFKFAGGLEPGAVVRFGGMKAGSVQAVRVDPDDSTRIEVDFNVARDIPLKADSVAKIASLGALGDNYVELTTGTRQAVAAAPGSVVIMIAPVSVCHQVSTTGQRPPPTTFWYQIHASGLMGSPTDPSRRRLERLLFWGHSSPQRMNARIAVGAV